MIFNVPQFIDVEDKVAGPLTWRQLLWMIGMGVLLLVLYNTLPAGVFYVIAVMVILVFAALAFYRPYNQPLVVFIGHAFVFLFRPKMSVWERPTNKPKERPEPKKVETPAPKDKKISLQEIKNLAAIMDKHGRV